MVNRNRGSGTRVLIDGLLAGRRPPGFAVEVRSHNAVAAAVAQGRADWGVAIAPVARAYGLAFLPLRAEQYDFAIPADRWDRPAVVGLPRRCSDEAETRRRLAELGFLTDGEEDRPMSLGAVILCGGQSRRMGQPKAWLPVRPERMLQRVVRLVSTVAGPIVVVAAPGQELPSLPAAVLVARDPGCAAGGRSKGWPPGWPLCPMRSSSPTPRPPTSRSSSRPGSAGSSR